MARYYLILCLLWPLLSSLCLAATHCRDVIFQLRVAADNIRFANPPDPGNDTAVLNFLKNRPPSGQPTNGTATVTGTFSLAAIYCSPPPDVHETGILQLLSHGSTYNKSYWTGFGIHRVNNWPLFAADRGYHTLAVDRLGHGLSKPFPDPVASVQVGLHVALVRAILSSLRQPNNPLRHKPFTRFVYVGHSYGSVVGVALVAAEPQSVAALVLTGHSTTPYPPVLSALTAGLESARLTLPGRFGSLPAGYGVLANGSLREHSFYTDRYDRALAARDNQLQDTVAVGELLVSAPGFTPVPGYRGPVMVVTGAVDQLLCNPAAGTCEDILNRTGLLFPASARYDYYAPPRTGHNVVLHESAWDTMKVVHHWLDKAIVRDVGG